MEKKNKKMTLEKLAEITQGGFEELRDEFKSELKNEIGGLRGEMNKRFERIDERFERVDEKFNQVLDNQDRVLKKIG